MTFISYAQNHEDVLLWRALGHVRQGFYIDVGANDPEEHSVTKAFYDAGWSGINIEPLPLYRDLFAAERPRDINLPIAIGSKEGSLTLYDVPSVPGWASPERSVADMHRSSGHEVHELRVPVRTLASVCEQHAKSEIHFLKVDVEGHEGEVLRGMDFRRFRPWIVVVEATLPNSRTTSHDTWESLVISEGYRFAYFDGLNRYYVSDEHADLVDVLAVQPNVFDAFSSHQLEKARVDAREARWMMEEVQEKLALEVDLRWKEHRSALRKVKELEGELKELLNSTSWRITEPLRNASKRARRLRAMPREVLRESVRAATRNEALRRILIPMLLLFPALNSRVARAIATIKHGGTPVTLPLSARRVADDLRRVLAQPEGE